MARHPSYPGLPGDGSHRERKKNQKWKTTDETWAESRLKFNRAFFFGGGRAASLWLFWHLHNFSAFWKHKQTQNASRCCQLCSAAPQNTGQRVCASARVRACDIERPRIKGIAAACERLSRLLLGLILHRCRKRRLAERSSRTAVSSSGPARARARYCKRQELPRKRN